jgi:hypothetical protein
MRNSSTPEKATGEVLRFCAGISPHTPVYVPVVPEEWASPGECFPSVKTAVERKGGRMVTGWALWMWPRVYIEAEHHAVHETEGGKLLDVTPKHAGEGRILFLRDDTADFDFATGKAKQNVRQPLSSDPAVAEYLAAAAAMSQFVLDHTENRIASFDRAKSAPTALRQIRAAHAFMRKFVRPDSFCTCASGRKVRRCCGMEEAVVPMVNGIRMTPSQFEAALMTTGNKV